MAQPKQPSDNQPQTRSAAAHRATVSANDLLLSALDDFVLALSQEHLPLPLRSSIDFLAIETAKVQGLCESITDDLVRWTQEGCGADPTTNDS